MKILVNAINLKVAGGLTVVFNFLEQIKGNDKFSDIQLIVVAPKGIGYESYTTERIKIRAVYSFLANPIFRFFFDFITFGFFIHKYKPNVVFTLGNYPIPTRKKQAVVVMGPYITYPEEQNAWKILSFSTYIDFRCRNLIFRQRLKYAELLLPQTITSERRLMNYYPRIIRTKVVPMAYSVIGINNTISSKSIGFSKVIGIKDFLCLTKYYPHKNIEIFLELAQLIKEQNLPYRIITTIEGNQGKGSQDFIDKIEVNKMGDTILNIGRVLINEVPNLYALSDALILPTLLESFSATYAEAMYFSKPIFTSDRDFSRDVCADAAFYFNPDDSHDILKQMQYGFNNPKILKEKIDNGYTRSLSFPNWSQVTDLYMTELKNLAKL